MLLYEFTYSNGIGLSDDEVMERCVELMKEEALLQGWQPDYSIVFGQIERRGDSSKYNVEIHGRWYNDEYPADLDNFSKWLEENPERRHVTKEEFLSAIMEEEEII